MAYTAAVDSALEKLQILEKSGCALFDSLDASTSPEDANVHLQQILGQLEELERELSTSMLINLAVESGDGTSDVSKLTPGTSLQPLIQELKTIREKHDKEQLNLNRFATVASNTLVPMTSSTQLSSQQSRR